MGDIVERSQKAFPPSMVGSSRETDYWLVRELIERITDLEQENAELKRAVQEIVAEGDWTEETLLIVREAQEALSTSQDTKG